MTTYHLRNESGIEVFTGTISPAPGGGSQPGATKIVRLDPFTAADVAAAPVLLYTPAAGEYVLAASIVDFVATDALDLDVGSAVTSSYRRALASVFSGGGGAGGNDVFAGQISQPTVLPFADPIYGGGGLGGNVPKPWVALTSYVAGALILADGHVWTNSGAAGTSSGSAPDFAGHIAGSVADGADIVWQDSGAQPSVGSCTAWLLVATGLV